MSEPALSICHVDTARTWRGGQAQIWGLVRGLAARGHQSVVFAPPGPLAERLTSAGLCWKSFSAANDLDAWSAWRLSRAFTRIRPDLVHLHSGRAHAVGAWAAGAAGSLPVVVSRRVDFEVSGAASRRWKYGRGVDRFLCISEGVRRVLLGAGIDARRLAVVPSGIEIGRWASLPDPAPLRRRLGIAEGIPILGTVAALAPHKDLFNLLAAAERLAQQRPQARWVVFGEGELRGRLEADRRERGLDQRVLFPGFTEDVGEALALMDVFVLSSYLEGLGTSVLDAQAAGVPVVATAAGGVPELIEDGVTGWLVPPKDPEALSRAVADALAHPDEATRRAGRAKQTVQRFSLESTVERTLAVYREVIAERGRCGS